MDLQWFQFVTPSGSLKSLKVGKERMVWVMRWTGSRAQPKSFGWQALIQRMFPEPSFLNLTRTDSRERKETRWKDEMKKREKGISWRYEIGNDILDEHNKFKNYKNHKKQWQNNDFLMTLTLIGKYPHLSWARRTWQHLNSSIDLHGSPRDECLKGSPNPDSKP